MSVNNNYFPNSDSERADWFSNFQLKIPVYQTTLGLSNDDVQHVIDDSKAFGYMNTVHNMLKQTLQTITSCKDLMKSNTANQQPLGAMPVMPVLPLAPTAVPSGIFNRMRSLVQRIKTAPGYTDSIGHDLNIIAPANTVDVTTIMPVLKAKPDVGRPHLKWKKGIAEALDLYCDHNDGNGFVFVGRFLRPEYLDLTQPSAGKISDSFKYKGVYVIADQQLGLMSQVLTCTASKQG